MDDEYEIYDQELADRIASTANVEEIFRRHGITNIHQAFRIGQSFSANPPVAAQRLVLKDLGYDFEEDQTITIMKSPA